MLSLNLVIGTFHPAVELAIAESVEHSIESKECAEIISRMLNRCEELVQDGKESGELESRVSEKSTGKKGEKNWSLTLRGKYAGIKLPDSPQGLLVRLNNYLEASAQLYLRVDSVTLPASVVAWAKAVKATIEKEAKEAKVNA